MDNSKLAALDLCEMYYSMAGNYELLLDTISRLDPSIDIEALKTAKIEKWLKESEGRFQS